MRKAFLCQATVCRTNSGFPSCLSFKKKRDPQKKMAYLEWKSTNLYPDDLALLAPPHWFNDNLITFCCDFLQYVSFAGHPFRFVPPGTALVLLHEEDPELWMECVRGSGILHRALVCLPVNNAPRNCEACGTHWSLLAFEARGRRWYVYDSLHTRLSENARRLAVKLGPVLGAKGTSIHVAPSPRQSNGYDCGCFCVTNMRHVAQRAAARQPIEALTSEIYPTHERKNIRKRIEQIRALVRKKILA